MPSTPISYWIGFHVALLVLLTGELVYARRQARLGRDPRRTALAATALWIVAALALAGFIQHGFGSAASVQYLAGYAVEDVPVNRAKTGITLTLPTDTMYLILE